MSSDFYYLDDLLAAIELAIGDLSEFSVIQKQADAILVRADGRSYKISIKPCKTRPYVKLGELRD